VRGRAGEYIGDSENGRVGTASYTSGYAVWVVPPSNRAIGLGTIFQVVS
jgi:hypothetical protein